MYFQEAELKGIAHAGVLKFLEEKQIKVDVISGTSYEHWLEHYMHMEKSLEDILAFSVCSFFQLETSWYLISWYCYSRYFQNLSGANIRNSK